MLYLNEFKFYSTIYEDLRLHIVFFYFIDISGNEPFLICREYFLFILRLEKSSLKSFSFIHFIKKLENFLLFYLVFFYFLLNI